ncbi:MAG: PqqD family protein [Eubacteriales bacterium]|jgi:hypothetical protein
MAKTKENYLDYIPRPNRLFETEVNDEGHIQIVMENKGVYNWIAQKLFKKPRFSHIELDDFGTFIWSQMDGEKNVFEIGKAVKDEFGDKAEPLYERLSKYIKILHDNHFVVYVNKLSPKNAAGEKEN